MRWLLLCLAVSLSLAVPVRTAPPGGPFADVPQTHWAYDAIQNVAQRGWFTGYPDGAFSGRRALTRYEFAVALQRLLQDFRRAVADGWLPRRGGTNGTPPLRQAVLWRLGIARWDAPEVSHLLRLTREFSAELRMLGGDPEQERDYLNHLEETALPPAIPPRKIDTSAEWRRGVELARADWQAGRPTLYSDENLEAGDLIDSTLGLPLTLVKESPGEESPDEESPDEESQHQWTAGYNDEIYRLILEHGLPANARQKGLDQILHPQQVFEGDETSVARLDAAHRNTATRRRDVHIRAEVDRASRLEALEVARDGHTLTLTPFSPEASVYSVDLVIGPPTSDVLFLRFVERRSNGAETVYQVLDLRNGKPLKVERESVEEP